MPRRMYIIPIIAVAFILFFTIFGERGLLRIYHLNKEKQEVQLKMEVLKGDNLKLVREVDALKNDRRYLESIARKDFGMVRKNEIIYQFPQKSEQMSEQKSIKSEEKR